MSANWGNNIELSLFGESHGKAIGIVIGNLQQVLHWIWMKFVGK